MKTFKLNPKISILMPNYNYEKFISSAIESVLFQTYKNFELIISDNASTDNSVNEIKKYNDERIILLRNSENIPLYQNIERAKSKATGEIITILHSDDFYESNFLQEIVNAYNKYPNKKVFITGVNNYHEKENIKLKLFPFSSEGLKQNNIVFSHLCIKNNIGNGVNSAFAIDLFNDSAIYNSKYRYAADYDLFLRLSKENDFVYINKILANYRIHSNNLSHLVNRNLDMFKEGFEICNDNFENDKKSNYLLKFIEFSSCINAIFYMGLKYNSGKLTREMLNCLSDYRPNVKINPFYFVLYLFSFSLDKKLNLSLYKILGIALLSFNSVLVKMLKKILMIKLEIKNELIKKLNREGCI